jgi:hypothetical protein
MARGTTLVLDHMKATRALVRRAVPAAILALGCLVATSVGAAEKASRQEAGDKKDSKDAESAALKELQATVAKLLGVVNDIKVSQDLLVKELSGLELACTVPDLLPLPQPGTLDPSGFCRTDTQGHLEVVVHNQGGGKAGPSKTTVVFHTGTAPFFVETSVDTPEIVGFAEAHVSVDFPADCVGGLSSGDCEFKIFVDDSEVVAESNESNNRVLGTCTLHII